MALNYIDESGAFIPGIPARDLSEVEVRAIAKALGTTPKALAKSLTTRGLYAAAKPAEEQDDGTRTEVISQNTD